ncbi:glycosyltransferase [Candidatus Photodesmus blepharus]|uniref:glycosyltransferase n=1 Tax=Candidatus Photodesmus blepharonis TaxID=1179155 RepID=UPI0006962045|nr:glycosyltransferase [Candidatus Photodesmus blepharus]
MVKCRLNKFVYYYRKIGILGLTKKIYFKIISKTPLFDGSLSDSNKIVYKKILDKIISEKKYRYIFVFFPIVDWKIELFQRPHHIASRIASDEVLYIFCTPNYSDNVSGFKKMGNNLYLTDCFELVIGIDGCIFHCYSTDNFFYASSYELCKSAVENGRTIVYEYIDEIHENISGQKIPRKVFDKHNMFLKDERVICIASADKLIEDVKKVRTNNYKLVTNGVDVEHFRKNINKHILPNILKSIVSLAVKNDKKIVGYFGAFASWFDYELVTEVAKTGDYEIVLIGVDYDGTIASSGFNQFKNIHYLGPIEYQFLPDHAVWFDICIIPFLINDITISTSPIKLFEYMAMERPIVTTAMPECMKYKGVFIGENHSDFIKKLDYASRIGNNNDYVSGLLELAHENSWNQKARDILEMVKLI